MFRLRIHQFYKAEDQGAKEKIGKLSVLWSWDSELLHEFDYIQRQIWTGLVLTHASSELTTRSAGFMFTVFTMETQGITRVNTTQHDEDMNVWSKSSWQSI